MSEIIKDWTETEAPLRLEVEVDPVGLVNEIRNPSGDQGSFGWETPVSGTTLVADGDLGLRFESASVAGGNYYISEPFAVPAGRYVAAEWTYRFAPTKSYRVRIDWLTSALAPNGSSVWKTRFESGADTDWRLAPVLAPAATAYARLRVELGGPNAIFPLTSGGYTLNMQDYVVAQATTTAALADLSTVSDAVEYVDILADTHEISVTREELNVGTLTATVVNPALDPSVADTLRPGRLFRLLAFDTDRQAYSPIIKGTLTNAKVAYSPLGPEGETARITLTGTDAVATLANTPRSAAVANIDDLPLVLEGAGVPWNVNGSGQQVDDTEVDVVIVNDGATALDQVALARDTVLGYAWVDRFGVLQAWDGLADPAVELVPNPSFETSTTGWWAQGDTTTPPTFTRQSGVSGSDGTWVGRLVSQNTTTSVMQASTYNALDASTLGAMPVVPGQGYRVAARARSVSASRTAFVTIVFYDKAGSGAAIVSTIGGAAVETASKVTVPGQWVDIDISTVAPPGAHAADVRVGFASSTAMGSGETHLIDAVSFRAEGVQWTVDDTVYNPNLVVDFDTDRCINSVSVLRQWTHRKEGPQGTLYGPYTDEASMATWGRHHVEVNVAGLPAVDIPGYAAAILTANATPEVAVQSLQVPMDRVANLPYAFVDLYALINVVNAETGIDENMRVARLTHAIRATEDGGEWLVGLEFASKGSVATPLAVAGPGVTPVPYASPYSRRWRGSDQNNIPTSTQFTLNFGSSSEDTKVTWENDGWTIVEEGIYTLATSVAWDNNSTGRRELTIRRNGSAIATSIVSASALNAASATQNLAVAFRLAVGDRVTFQVFQNSGGNRSIIGGETVTFATIVKAGE